MVVLATSCAGVVTGAHVPVPTAGVVGLTARLERPPDTLLTVSIGA